MSEKHQDSRCGARTKTGKPCRAAAMDGGFCFFHANPKKAAELGRIGGRRNARLLVGGDSLPELDTVTSVRDTVERLISDVYARKLNPRIAAGLAPLLRLQLLVIEKTDFEQRLSKVEEQLERTRPDEKTMWDRINGH